MLGVCLSLLNENTFEGRKGCSFAHATVCFVFKSTDLPSCPGSRCFKGYFGGLSIPHLKPDLLMSVQLACPISSGWYLCPQGGFLAKDTLLGWLAQKGWFSSENSDWWVWCRAALSVCPLPSYHCCYKEDSAAYIAIAVLFIARSTKIHRCCLESALYARLQAAEVQQLLGEQARHPKLPKGQADGMRTVLALSTCPMPHSLAEP